MAPEPNNLLPSPSKLKLPEFEDPGKRAEALVPRTMEGWKGVLIGVWLAEFLLR